MDDAELASIESSIEDEEASLDQLATSYHEAGHAVAAWRLGRSLHSVSIVPDETSAGRIIHRRLIERVGDEGAPSPEHEQALRDHVVMVFAGPITEEIATGRHDPDTARRDHELAEDLVAAMQLDSAEQEQRCLGWLAVRSRDLVLANWHVIEGVASALIEREQLGSRTVREIIREADEARER